MSKNYAEDKIFETNNNKKKKHTQNCKIYFEKGGLRWSLFHCENM